jgi:proteic killer suppression protein
MIKHIRHKGLRLLWEEGDSSKLPAEHTVRIERILIIINKARQVPYDFAAFKEWNIHRLKGDMKDFWSIKVSKIYRIIFKFDGQDAYDIDYIDYH